jgi:hypothetical protein
MGIERRKGKVKRTWKIGYGRREGRKRKGDGGLRR